MVRVMEDACKAVPINSLAWTFKANLSLQDDTLICSFESETADTRNSY